MLTSPEHDLSIDRAGNLARSMANPNNDIDQSIDYLHHQAFADSGSHAGFHQFSGVSGVGIYTRRCGFSHDPARVGESGQCRKAGADARIARAEQEFYSSFSESL